MIFVTVGAQSPFDRLVRSVDTWAEHNGRRDVLAQIGAGGWRPQSIRWIELLPPAEFRRMILDADCIVAHAGMGTIITALEFGKPILVMPRQAALGETRNDHQLGTARRQHDLGRVNVAMDESQLQVQLDQIETLLVPQPISSHASLELMSTLRQFIDGGDPLPAPRGLCEATERPATARTSCSDVDVQAA